MDPEGRGQSPGPRKEGAAPSAGQAGGRASLPEKRMSHFGDFCAEGRDPADADGLPRSCGRSRLRIGLSARPRRLAGPSRLPQTQLVMVFFFIMGRIILTNDLSDNLNTVALALGGRPRRRNQDDDPQGDNVPEAADTAEKLTSKSTVCHMAQAYHLSEREVSVMVLLLKGRSMKRTAEELYLSIGTVNTYVKRIYAKMGVHTRQELIDRFEEFRRSTSTHCD